MRDLDDITGAIVDASVRLHRDYGAGRLASVYEAGLAVTDAFVVVRSIQLSG